jgi:putative ATPase
LIFELKSLNDKEMAKVVLRVLKYYKECEKDIKIDKEALLKLIKWSSGDARKLITAMETIIELFMDENNFIKLEDVELAMPSKHIHYDKSGNEHFDVAQCYQTAIQNSDADSALYWLAKWTLVEDPAYICRRMMISAAEDCAENPHAQTAAMAACLAVERCGLPEARINLAQATIELAKSKRSRAAIEAFDLAMNDVKNGTEVTAIHADSSKHNDPNGYTKINKKYLKNWRED